MKRTYTLVLLCLSFLMMLGITSCDKSQLDQFGETTAHEHAFGAWRTVTVGNAEGVLQERLCACGEKETRTVPTSVGLAYTPNADNETCTVTGMGSCTDTLLNIPATLDGLRVTAIGKQAFKDCSQLIEVILPDTVIRIEDFAFFMCEKLESIALSQSLESIGESAFFDCSALTGLELPATVKEIDILMIAGCRSLTVLSVAEANPTFYSEGNCIIERKSKRLVLGCNASLIPDGVTAIAMHAFQDASQLNQIVLPNSVIEIEAYAFRGCSGLTSVTLSSDVTTIGNGAFAGCRSLESITIPEGVTSIGAQAFSNCEKLTSVSIPASVTQIGSQAFVFCIALRGLTFAGTVEQWNAISFGGALVQTMLPFVVTCADGTVNLQ